MTINHAVELFKEIANNLYGKKGIKKSCENCGYYVYLCPDVEHECPICHGMMDIELENDQNES